MSGDNTWTASIPLLGNEELTWVFFSSPWVKLGFLKCLLFCFFSIRCWWLLMWNLRTWGCPQKLIFQLKKFTMWVFNVSIKRWVLVSRVFWRMHIHVAGSQNLLKPEFNPSSGVSLSNSSFHPPMHLEEKLCVTVWPQEFHSSSFLYDLDASYLFLSLPWPQSLIGTLITCHFCTYVCRSILSTCVLIHLFTSQCWTGRSGMSKTK